MRVISLSFAVVLFFGFLAQGEDSVSVTSGSVQSQNIGSSNSFVKRIIPEMNVISSSFAGTGFQSDSFTNVSAKTGTGVGLLTDLSIGEGDIQLETGVLYRQMGAVISPNLQTILGSAGAGLTTTINLRYLSLPLLVVAYDNLAPKVAVFVKAGLLASALVSKGETSEIQQEFGFSVGFNGPGNFTDGMQNFSLDSTLGLGMKFKLNPQTSFIAEVSYLRGLTSLYTSEAVFNSSLSGTAGLALEL